MVPPERKELRFFTPVTDAAKHAGAAVGELLSRYANLFPSIHPRDFQVTGEASPAYVYSAAALRFFAQPNLKLARVVLLLREPAERTASEHRHKSDQPRGRRWTGDAPLRTTAAAAHGALLRCGAPALYAAISRAAPASVDKLSPQQLANLAWAFGKNAKGAAPELFDAIARSAPPRIDEFGPQHISNLSLIHI